MGRGSRGRGRGSVGDHPEDEEDFYEEEMEVRFSSAWVGLGVAGGWWAPGHKCYWGKPVRRRWKESIWQVSVVNVHLLFGIEKTSILFRIKKVPKGEL